MENNKEIRSISVEYRLDKEKRSVEGRAIPFNVSSPNREGFRETILPSAVEGVIERSDIFLLYNHDRSKGFLARNNKGKGSLKIDVRDDGVYFSFDAKQDNISNYVYERLLNGELDETSWAFTVSEEGETWAKGEDGVYERIISQFDGLYDFSIVDQSYYGIPNVVGCKRFAEIQEEEKAENERKMKEAEEKRLEEERKAAEEKEQQIREYYDKLKEDLNNYIK